MFSHYLKCINIIIGRLDHLLYLRLVQIIHWNTYGLLRLDWRGWNKQTYTMIFLPLINHVNSLLLIVKHYYFENECCFFYLKSTNSDLKSFFPPKLLVLRAVLTGETSTMIVKPAQGLYSARLEFSHVWCTAVIHKCEI